MASHGDQKGWIRTVEPDMAPPSLKDNTADTDRLIKGIGRVMGNREVVVDFTVVRCLPSLLRGHRCAFRALICNTGRSWRLMDLFPARENGSFWGLAVDLGSSTIVVRLIDLASGAITDERSLTNPQTEIGQDILTRIHFASKESGLSRLQELVIRRINEEIKNLTKLHALDLKRIVGISLAGNTTMTHLFLGLDPCGICREPYIPVINKTVPLKASELGLAIHPEARYSFSAMWAVTPAVTSLPGS